MGEQNQPNGLETQWAFLGRTDDSYYLPVHELNKKYMAGVGSDEIHCFPVPSPLWIHDQQTPHNYAEYLAENVVPEVQVDASAEASGFRLVEGSADMIPQEIRYPRPYYEGVPLNCLIGSERPRGVLTWDPRGDARHASGPCPEASAAGSSYPSKGSRKARVALSDRHRRMKIAERIDALGELLPCSKQGGKASQMDEIIDHIKYLQFQMKSFRWQETLGLVGAFERNESKPKTDVHILVTFQKNVDNLFLCRIIPHHAAEKLHRHYPSH